MTDQSREIKDVKDAINAGGASPGGAITPGGATSPKGIAIVQPPPATAKPPARTGMRQDNVSTSKTDAIDGPINETDIFMLGIPCEPYHKVLMIRSKKDAPLHIIVGEIQNYTTMDASIDNKQLSELSGGLFIDIGVFHRFCVESKIKFTFSGNTGTVSCPMMERTFKMVFQVKETDPKARLKDVIAEFKKYRDNTALHIRNLTDQLSIMQKKYSDLQSSQAENSRQHSYHRSSPRERYDMDHFHEDIDLI